MYYLFYFSPQVDDDSFRPSSSVPVSSDIPDTITIHMDTLIVVWSSCWAGNTSTDKVCQDKSISIQLNTLSHT